MKTFIVLALFVAAALSVPVDPKDAVITKYDNDNIGVGPYSYAYATSDGIAQQEIGDLNNVGTENEALRVSGQYSYVAPDGQQIVVQYTADENGFHPEGAHIPKK